MRKVISFGKSDTGLIRTNNEDVFVVEPELGVSVLADGMGGAAAGELASQIFAETAIEVFREQPKTEQECVELVQTAFGLANLRILDHVKQIPEHAGMGCTAELIVFFEDRFALGHVGDSRTYLFRKGQLKQLTKDHSLVQEQLDQGLITPEAARHHRLRNVILRAVGTKVAPAVDIVRGIIKSGDIFLLCSDGLTDMIEDDAMFDILSMTAGIEEKAEKLIESANLAGGKDNVTVVLNEIVQE